MCESNKFDLTDQESSSDTFAEDKILSFHDLK